MILLSGPCVIESKESLFRIAEALQPYHDDARFDFYFKASFDKANRTALESFRGPGLEEGLRLLQDVKETFGYKIVTDVHESYQVTPLAEVVDMLQIPAFLCRQTDLLVTAAQTDALINIKKGQFMNPADMQYSVLKVLKTRGCDALGYEYAQQHGVLLTERGSSFGYGNLVVDMRSLVTMRRVAPVLFDATHSVQMPGSGGGTTGGDRSMVPYLSKAAAAVGVDGFFFETHFDPSQALSDGPNMVTLETLRQLTRTLIKIQEITKE